MHVRDPRGTSALVQVLSAHVWRRRRLLGEGPVGRAAEMGLEAGDGAVDIALLQRVDDAQMAS